MISSKLPSTCIQLVKLIQTCRMAPRIPTAWLPVSYVMAHIEIESGFDPNIKASDFATTGSVGLMQVASPTVGDVSKAWPNLPGVMYDSNQKMVQTDPYTSICTGMLYLHTCKEYLLPIFYAPLSYRHIAMAYNEGPGNAGRGIADDAYYYKWLSAQQRFAFLDVPDPMIG